MAFVIYGLLLGTVAFVAIAVLRNYSIRLLASASIGLVGGLAVQHMGGDLITGWAVSALLAFPFVGWRKTRKEPAFDPVQSSDLAPQEPILRFRAAHGHRWFWGRKGHDSADAQVAAAMDAAVIAAPFAASRIAVAKRTCLHLLETARTSPLDAALLEIAVIIRKHVPILVEKCFDQCRVAEPAGKLGLLDELVCTFEDLAGEAERLTRHSVAGSVDAFQQIRQHIHARVRENRAW